MAQMVDCLSDKHKVKSQYHKKWKKKKNSKQKVNPVWYNP
jgi:hypothetical protein